MTIYDSSDYQEKLGQHIFGIITVCDRCVITKPNTVLLELAIDVTRYNVRQGIPSVRRSVTTSLFSVTVGCCLGYTLLLLAQQYPS